MKTLKTLLFIFLLACTLPVTSQTPEFFNYQTVIRYNAGDILANQTVSFRINILETSSYGTSVYTEDHTVATSITGLANLQIGNGIVVLEPLIP